jgi:hypothetical protein
VSASLVITLPAGAASAVMRAMKTLLAVVLCSMSLAACKPLADGPRHRERDTGRDRECRDPSRPRAYFYPAENRTDYGPDDPRKDGCELLVADHLFCCPDAARSTDR